MICDGRRSEPHPVAVKHTCLTPGSPRPPQWSGFGGPSLACSLCVPAAGRSRDVGQVPGMACAPGPENSRLCTTSSLPPTSQKTTSGPADERRARSHAPLSASTSWRVTTIRILSSRMRRTPAQTVSWARWGWFNSWDAWWRLCGRKK